MGVQGRRVVCDCCGRQIVGEGHNGKYTVVSKGVDCMNLGFGKIACPPCSQTERQWQDMTGGEDYEKE